MNDVEDFVPNQFLAENKEELFKEFVYLSNYINCSLSFSMSKVNLGIRKNA